MYGALPAFLSTLSLRRATLLVKVLVKSHRFLSTLSLRRATVFVGFFMAQNLFLSTLSLRRATYRFHLQPNKYLISIHALLAESDRKPSIQVQHPLNFYPRSPCGERPGRVNNMLTLIHFYPRSPCGERRGPQNTRMPSGSFLSTLSLRRATGPEGPAKLPKLNFYPRSPCGERQ